MPDVPVGELRPTRGSHWPRHLLLAAVIAFVAITRFAHLDARPFHHDESLFAYYAWSEATTGDYNAGGYDRHSPDGTVGIDRPERAPTHHPLLHGPLQIELVGLTLYAAKYLGVIGSGDAAARTVAATCAVLLFFVLAGMARDLGGGPALALAAVALAVSPEIWYYGRFCRNEPIFIFVTLAWVASLARVWRLPLARDAEAYCGAGILPAGGPPQAGATEAEGRGQQGSALPRPNLGSGAHGAGWVVAACILSAVLVALKENSLFLIFDAATFWLLLLVFQQWDARRAASSRGRLSLWRLAWGYRYAWIGGLALAWLLLETVYTNHFVWNTSFLDMYADILHYWTGQHSEHRLYGGYHYYLPILALYEPVAILVLTVAAARLFTPWKRPVAAALLLLAVVLGLWVAIKGFGYIEGFPRDKEEGLRLLQDGQLLKSLHMTSPGHLALAFGLGWVTLYGAWRSLERGRRFRAFLVWWAGLSVLQYGYAGEKVPWISVHMALPGLLLAADLAGEVWSQAFGATARGSCRAGSSVAKTGRAAAVALVALWLAGCAWNVVQGYRVCFVHPTNPGERLIYNHTQFPIQTLGREMRQMALIPLGKPGAGTPTIEGEAAWPLLWYLHGTDYIFTSDAVPVPAALDRVPLLACDASYAEAHAILGRQYDLEPVPLRCAWVPDPLHLLTPLNGALRERYPHDRSPKPLSAADETFLDSRRPYYGLGAWATLWHYVMDPERLPWGDPEIVAQPLDITVGRRRSAAAIRAAGTESALPEVPDLPDSLDAPDLAAPEPVAP